MQFKVTLYAEADSVQEIFKKYAHLGRIWVKEIDPKDRTDTAYPEFCRNPRACRGRGSCPMDPTCAD